MLIVRQNNDDVLVQRYNILVEYYVIPSYYYYDCLYIIHSRRKACDMYTTC
jgi:predicted nucleic acid-binding protein